MSASLRCRLTVAPAVATIILIAAFSQPPGVGPRQW